MLSKDKNWVLVTGAAGFIGSHLSEALLKNHRNVLAVDNFDSFYSRDIKERNLEAVSQVAKENNAKFHFVCKDINEIYKDSFSEYSIESIIHLAGKAGVRPSILDQEAYFRANVLGTIRILEFAVSRMNIPIVFGSSSSVYGNDSSVPFSEKQSAISPISPYAASKRSAELICLANNQLYGLRVALLRFFTVYGPRQRPDLAIHKFGKLIECGEPIELFGNGSTSRDYTFFSDIVSGIVSAELWLRQSPQGTCEIFNLGGSHPVSLLEIVSLLEEALGKKAKLKWLESQPGDVERTFADISKARELLGFDPKTRLSQGLRQFVDWMRASDRRSGC